MTDKIAVVPFGPQPNERIIALLREALRDAKAGKIQAIGIAVACTTDDPGADLGRSTETILSYTSGWRHSLVAAVDALAFRTSYERFRAGSPLPDPIITDEDE
jgi:hypothetical protein